MASSEDKYSRRRLQSSYISTVISMSLVLFMLGLLGMILLHAKRLSDHVKENIGFSVILKETVKEVDIIRLQKTLDARPYVKSTEFVDKDRAAKELEEELGENFTEFLGYNPLLS
ncbi:MAG: cell division protein FtsX, partial [Flavobacteriales bacterium]